MLKTIRQFQRGILIVVAIIIIIAFSFLYSDFDFARGTLGESNCVIRVDGRCYRDEEAIKLARFQGLAYTLGMNDFADTLRGPDRRDMDPTDFVINLLVLRKEARDLGIEPSVTEIKESVPKLPMFERAPWAMSKEFIRSQLGQFGLNDDDMAQLVKDYLAFNKMKDLIGAGIQPIPKVIENTYIQENQRFTASLIDFRRDEFKDKIKVSEEKIKQYFDDRNKEEEKSAAPSLDPAETTDPSQVVVTLNPNAPKPMMTEVQRGFNYLKFVPNKLGETATQEETDNAELAFARAVNDIYSRLTERGVDFLTVAKSVAAEKHPFQVTLADLPKFSRDDAPEEVKDKYNLLKSLFSGTLKTGSVSVPYPDSDGNYYIFRLDEIEEPRKMTLEEARPAIITALTAKESNSLTNDAANEAKAKLQEALKAGKTIAQAAAENNYKISELPNFSAMDPPADTEDSFQVMASVRELSPGQISAVMERPNAKGYFLTYVDKIEIYKDENKDAELKRLSEAATKFEKNTLFRSWLTQRANAAEPERNDSLLNVAARLR